ncbi:MAG: HAD-IIB family hydrolase [Epsilonproteobacteria bacterium]|nr:HAD-IIB family hydrolase [Campylobacterota bacterium]
MIFTDLDGSLLNHEDYSFDEAKEMLGFIQAQKIPLIYTTSKTRKECEILQQEMKITGPFIVENGAAIYYPDREMELLGVEHSEIKAFIGSIADEFKINYFSNMKIEEIMEYTLFEYEQAAYAKSRDFSEPFLIHDERRLTELEVLAEAQGMKILKGGRFYHCVGIDQDKGMAVERAMKHFEGYTSIGLGDNYNDIAMLNVVNIPVLIPHHEGKYIDFSLEGLHKASHKGSKGWNSALKGILSA